MLPELKLDDRTFQELISEGRSRIARSCPEWSEHNVSDPGITLIEQFAWLTETLIYRLNRLPEKVHLRLLELIGVTLNGPAAARADVRFWLSDPVASAVEIPGGTEVSTGERAADDVVFRLAERHEVSPVRAIAYAVERGGALEQLDVEGGVVRPPLDLQPAFGVPPEPEDAMYVGFDRPLSRLVLQLEFEASNARVSSGVDPYSPPLVWEVSARDTWEPVAVLSDDTGGFSFGSGVIQLQIPPRADETIVGQRQAHWLRCRVVDSAASGSYTNPPDIYVLNAAAIGMLVPMEHAAAAPTEVIGTSDGTPGQHFRLSHSPVLALEPGEYLEVKDAVLDRWDTWQRVDSFAASGQSDRHYVVDAAAGTVEFGPAVRQPDGGWRQYASVPQRGSELRMTGYRYGGGRRGNVEAGALSVLRTPLPSVALVANPRSAFGGTDGETLENARIRAPLAMHARDRAVTAADYEYLARAASPRVARALCVAGDDGGPVTVHLLPTVVPPDRSLAYDELIPDRELRAEVAGFLDARRPVGVSVDILPCRFRGISVAASVRATPGADARRVEEEIIQALNVYLNPLIGGSALGPGTGWAFGRALNQGELYGVIQSVAGVQFVEILRMFEIDLVSGGRESEQGGTQILLKPDELIASGIHLIHVTQDE